MQANQISLLLEVGAQDRVRLYLKKLALKERLPLLHACFPYINTPAKVRFLQDHFAVEVVSLVACGQDYAAAEGQYRQRVGQGKRPLRSNK